MNRRRFMAGSSAAFFISPLSAEETNEAIAIGGDRFRIDKQEFHLADIRAPSAYALGHAPMPYFREATERLQESIEETSLEIKDVAPKTRWNARVVKAYRFGGNISLQEQMVAIGAARVAPQSDDLAFIDHLMAVERKARDAEKGMWALQAYRVWDALNADPAIGGYHIIEGVVLSARKVRSRFYLNFGEDYRTDFTASARSAVYRQWVGDNFDPALLTGARVRVRGFVVHINGPSIDMTHRRQIEIL
jgi:endonuclease YncB( thermonuclease family)